MNKAEEYLEKTKVRFPALEWTVNYQEDSAKACEIARLEGEISQLESQKSMARRKWEEESCIKGIQTRKARITTIMEGKG